VNLKTKTVLLIALSLNILISTPKVFAQQTKESNQTKLVLTQTNRQVTPQPQIVKVDEPKEPTPSPIPTSTPVPAKPKPVQKPKPVAAAPKQNPSPTKGCTRIAPGVLEARLKVAFPHVPFISRLAFLESGMNNCAKSPTKDYGLMQINCPAHLKTVKALRGPQATCEDLYDVDFNLYMAKRISGNGTSFKPWSACKKIQPCVQWGK
jgi:hypothetical protein